jgi:hypothetical protein
MSGDKPAVTQNLVAGEWETNPVELIAMPDPLNGEVCTCTTPCHQENFEKLPGGGHELQTNKTNTEGCRQHPPQHHTPRHTPLALTLPHLAIPSKPQTLTLSSSSCVVPQPFIMQPCVREEGLDVYIKSLKACPKFGEMLPSRFRYLHHFPISRPTERVFATCSHTRYNSLSLSLFPPLPLPLPPSSSP